MKLPKLDTINIISLLIVVVILTSIIMVLHNRKKFDSISWKEKDDMTFPNRKSMVEDLIEKRFY